MPTHATITLALHSDMREIAMTLDAATLRISQTTAPRDEQPTRPSPTCFPPAQPAQFMLTSKGELAYQQGGGTEGVEGGR